MTVRIDALLFLIVGVIFIYLLTLAGSVLMFLLHYLIDIIYSRICKRRGHEFHYSRPDFYSVIFESFHATALVMALFFFVFWYLYLREAGVVFQ